MSKGLLLPVLPPFRRKVSVFFYRYFFSKTFNSIQVIQVIQVNILVYLNKLYYLYLLIGGNTGKI